MGIEWVLSRVKSYLNNEDAQLRFFVPGEDEVPVSGGKLSHMDIINIVTVALSGWVTEGRFCDLFEKKLKKFVGLNHAILTNSGSSANLVAMLAMKDEYGIPEKSLIVTSALAFPTTVAPIIHAGFIPYFVDVDPETLNPDISDLVDLAKDSQVRGMILAHTLGFPIDLTDASMEFIRNKKFIIEDCCDALGSKVRGEHVGMYGDVATFSFFPAHHISTGEGGAILSNDGRLMKSIRSYVNWGRDCWCKPGENNTCGKRFDYHFSRLPNNYDHKYTFSKIGLNVKMTDLQASIGSSQMERIDEITDIRKKHYNYLMAGFTSIKNFNIFFGTVRNEYDFSPFGFPIACKVSNRNHVVQFLESRNIRTRPIFSGNITRQPMMDHINYMQHGTLDGCNYVAENYFWIGCHPELTIPQLDYVISTFKEYLSKL